MTDGTSAWQRLDAITRSVERISRPGERASVLPVHREDVEERSWIDPPGAQPDALHAELQRGQDLDRDLAHDLGAPQPLRSSHASR